jgi:hypothetical protein
MKPLGVTPRKPLGKYVRSETYSAVHQRLVRWRGKASGHPCVDCGQPAQDWAYNGKAAEPLTEPHQRSGRSVEYSADANDYDPMCRSCHTIRDKSLDGPNRAMSGLSVLA